MARTVQSARKATKPKKTSELFARVTKENSKKKKERIKKLKKLENKLHIPKAYFRRLVKRLTIETHPYTMSSNWSTAALSTLQEVAEFYIARLFQDSYLVTSNRNVKTLALKDLRVARRLRGELSIPPEGGWRSHNENSTPYKQSSVKFNF